MSGVGSNSSTPLNEPFLIFFVAVLVGRKSQTAAAMMHTSTALNRPHTAFAISSAVVTETSSTPLGGVSAVGPLTSTTCDETAAAASAIAKPIFPDERL